MKLALSALRVKEKEVDPMKATVPRDKQVLPLKQEVDGEFAPLSDAVDAASNVLEAFGEVTGDPNAQAAIIGPQLRERYEEVYERVLALVRDHAMPEPAFRGPRRVIKPALSVLDQVKDAELRDLRDMVEFTCDLEGLRRIFGADFPATVTLDPSEVLKLYESRNLFRQEIDRDGCELAAVDLIDVSATFSGV